MPARWSAPSPARAQLRPRAWGAEPAAAGGSSPAGGGSHAPMEAVAWSAWIWQENETRGVRAAALWQLSDFKFVVVVIFTVGHFSEIFIWLSWNLQ